MQEFFPLPSSNSNKRKERKSERLTTEECASCAAAAAAARFIYVRTGKRRNHWYVVLNNSDPRQIRDERRSCETG